jgi:hypothetical protein
LRGLPYSKVSAPSHKENRPTPCQKWQVHINHSFIYRRYKKR